MANVSEYERGFRDGVQFLADRLRDHYPHSVSILRCIDLEESIILGGDR